MEKNYFTDETRKFLKSVCSEKELEERLDTNGFSANAGKSKGILVLGMNPAGEEDPYKKEDGQEYLYYIPETYIVDDIADRTYKKYYITNANLKIAT